VGGLAGTVLARAQPASTQNSSQIIPPTIARFVCAKTRGV
jgi:hypothetical protein